MKAQLAHGITLLLYFPLLGMIAHALCYRQHRKNVRFSAPGSVIKFPRQRVYALYLAALATTAFIAATESYAFFMCLVFGLIFFIAATAALRCENRARQQLRQEEHNEQH